MMFNAFGNIFFVEVSIYFGHLLNWVVVFLLLSWESFLYILETSSWLDIWVDIFSLSISSLLILFLVFFSSKFFFNQVQLSVFYLMSGPFVVSKKSFFNPESQRFSPIFKKPYHFDICLSITLSWFLQCVIQGFFFFFFWLCREALGVLLSLSGFEVVPPALGEPLDLQGSLPIVLFLFFFSLQIKFLLWMKRFCYFVV